MKKTAAGILFISILIFSSCSLWSVRNRYDYSWAEEYKYIAHGCGEIDGYYCTNTREALITNYDRGCRLFEVDLINTSDSKLVCWHGWTDGLMDDLLPEECAHRFLNNEEFDNLLVAGKYHTMDFEYLARFMSEHQDMYIVTDTKSPENEVTIFRFNEIIDTANEIDPSILDRIIPQIYYDEMLDEISELYNWKSVIYTLYLLPLGTYYSDIVDFVSEKGIRVITTSEERINDDFINDLSAQDVYVYMHTFNDPDEVSFWESKGVRGFYTDTLM